MDLVLCHTTADFDTLGAAVGVTRLRPGTRIVLTGGCHPGVQEFLALHRDEYPLIERRSVNPRLIRSLTIVDTQQRDRLGKAAEWLALDAIEIRLYDHHSHIQGDIPATWVQIEPVGSTSTLIVEHLQAQAVTLSVAEATVMALGIHVDTGSLTYEQATDRDALALAWLMQQGANLRTIAEFVEPGLSPRLQTLLTTALETIQTEVVAGQRLAWVVLDTPGYAPGLSSLAARLIDLTESDVLLLASYYRISSDKGNRLTIIGRARVPAFSRDPEEGVNLAKVFEPWGGGGHATAAALTLRDVDPESVLPQLLDQVRRQLPQPPTARDLMSSPVRTIRPDTTIAEAQRILLRYGHSGLSVVNQADQLVGVISRRDIDLALHHGFSHAPVRGYMTRNPRTIAPDTLLPEIEDLMVTYDIGRLPVLNAQGNLIGIVTRTDVLRQLHQTQTSGNRSPAFAPSVVCPLPREIWQRLQRSLQPALWDILMTAAKAVEQQGWHLYLVGGAVRTLMLAPVGDPLVLSDIDLVVDGFEHIPQVGAGVEIAQVLQQTYPESRLQVHGQFQTAALVWHKHPVLDSLMIDIATARTEFYPYPAANPEVEASSIRQDLYRRDFTINAMAIRLTPPRTGELLDFFGGLPDLQARKIRVLHPNSFIEDPTRIYRAVRFAVRLGFHLDDPTERYIRQAIASGIYAQMQQQSQRAPALQTRLKMELKYILQATNWPSALRLLGDLDALQCIHSSLHLDDDLWWQLRRADRWLRRFDPQHTLSHWQVLLELILAHLAPPLRGPIAAGMQLPISSIERLQNLEAVETQITQALPACERPSQVVQVLMPYALELLILVGCRSDTPLASRSYRAASPPEHGSIRRYLWRYLTTWSQVKPLLDGHDLKQLGYQPGRQFKLILDDLHAATLDNVIRDRAEAEHFLRDRYPA